MKAIMESTPIDNCDNDLVTFAQTIDFAELFDHAKAFTAVDCTFNQPEITTSRGYIYINFTSDNIVAQTGAFAAILKNCYFNSFGNGVSRNRDTGEAGYFVSLHITYEHKDGGANGMEVVRASYTERMGWTFWDVT